MPAEPFPATAPAHGPALETFGMASHAPLHATLATHGAHRARALPA